MNTLKESISRCIKKIFICATVALSMACMTFFSSCGKLDEAEEKKYTYEELVELSDMELLDLFLENGLELDEDLTYSLSKEHIASVFKKNFQGFVRGLSLLSYPAWKDVAEQTKVIYESLTK